MTEALAPGAIVDNCRLEQVIGSGAFGVVYRAHHLGLEQPRAFKFLQPRHGIDEALRRRFLSEARHTASLAHPNVVVVHNVGEFAGAPFIHMEYLHGATLRSRLHGRPAAPDWTLRVIDQVLAALATAHSRGIVHRDIKPDNAMALSDGSVKVVDFGLSLNVEANASRLTQGSRVVMGTPLYMAPEQWRSSSVGPPADVWSVGVMLYELLSGAPPFSGADLIELAERIRGSLHAPLSRRANVPRGLSDVVDRMLAKSAADRPADAGQARVALRQVLRSLPATFGPDANEPPVPDTVPPLSITIEGFRDLPSESHQPRRMERLCDETNMVLLPGGSFFMGADEGDVDERPRHLVRLSPFLLDVRPISRRQFATFLSLWGSSRDDQGHPLLDPELAGLERIGMTWEPISDETDPVTGVTWYGAMAYARWAGVSLPSEAQCEYALAQLINPASEAPGWQALLGQVRLWCVDTYDERYYEHHPERDPVNDQPGAFVAVRGSSRTPVPARWSASHRQFATRHELNLDVGFCCALSLSAPIASAAESDS